jgi:hypothetical protein
MGLAVMTGPAIAHWHLLGRDDSGRLGIELEASDGTYADWWFRDDDQLRRIIIHLISVYLGGKMPDPQERNRG